MKVTIIGGGVIGLCSAYYLQKAGYEVTVIEKNDITDGCSFGNMGYVSPSHFIPIATPGIVSQGLRWMLNSSSPFYIKPRLNWDLIRWGMTFWKSANAKMIEKNTPHLNDLLQLSRHLMNDLKTGLKDSFPMIEKGIWMLYRLEKTGDHEKHLAEQAQELGLKTVICNPQQVQEYEPEVEVKVAGGVLYIDDCHIDTASFMRAMSSHLQNAGVKFWLNTEVTGFEKNNERITSVITDKNKMECDELIIANGSWLGKISKKLGVYIPMQPGKGYSLSYNNLEKNLHYPSILVDDRTATTPIDRWLRIGGTMELSGHNNSILPKRVMAIYNAFKKYYPKMNLPLAEPKKAWYGYRPVSPDGMPYIGRHNKFSNLCYAGGHAMLGVSAAAGTGHLIEQVIGKKPTAIDISAFNPLRFS
ncbi:MAG: FAD-dependent oxidoreductase [Bacteroidetes bacterium]|nr:FAD-dependent oxidoreductase [Bacteroidota bacterium]MBS1631790.1 FAD-dependent oxidoreductase [Bacteroidota bacterium]